MLQALHHTWQPLAEFCRGLEADLGEPVQANSYYTPAGSQGFGVHHDTHDVLCLQVAGEKRWLVYEPLLELPLKQQRWSSDLGTPGPVVQDLTLRAGDTLYLPRGWLHEALTSESDSLHITVGIHVYTRLDALRAAVESLAGDVEVRRSLGDDGSLPGDVLDRLRTELAPDDVRERRRRRLVDTRRPVLPDQLRQAPATVDAQTEVERRPTVIADLDGTTLVFEGKRVAFPTHVADEVSAIFSASGPFRTADLPGVLDDAGRLVLVRRLIREGFLRRSAAAG